MSTTNLLDFVPEEQFPPVIDGKCNKKIATKNDGFQRCGLGEGHTSDHVSVASLKRADAKRKAKSGSAEKALVKAMEIAEANGFVMIPKDDKEAVAWVKRQEAEDKAKADADAK